MGKISGCYTRILVGGYNLSPVSNNLEIGHAFDTHDVAGFECIHHFIPGQEMISFTHGGLFEQDTAHAALKVTGGEQMVTTLVGQNAAPVVGDPAHIFYSWEGQYNVSPATSAAVPFNAAYMAKGDRAGGWGIALAPIITITNTTDGTGVDNGAGTSNGGIASLHVLLAAATDTYVVKVQHSTDDITYADLATFSLDGSAIGAEFELVAAGTTVNRYVRYQATRTGSAGDDLTLAVAFARL